MAGLSILIILFYILLSLIPAGILIYLILKRIESRGNEGFEERDN